MNERGFRYDRLSVADDSSVEAVRERIYACPCGFGPWVSVQTGEMYFYHGGNEREQWELQKRGPWVRANKDADTRFAEQVKRGNAFREELEGLKDKIADLIGVER